MTDDEFRKLLARHLEAENAHRLADTLGTLTSDCLFEDVALGRRFGGHEGAAAYYRMWWDGFETEVSPERHISASYARLRTQNSRDRYPIRTADLARRP